ncbi:hypothetical protein C5K14_25435 [Shigella flexneri]|nr:hypothetical protein C5K14_25435 [Shigella flexneri]
MIFKIRSNSFGFELFRVTLGFSAHYEPLQMPFYFRKECPLSSGYDAYSKQPGSIIRGNYGRITIHATVHS